MKRLAASTSCRPEVTVSPVIVEDVSKQSMRIPVSITCKDRTVETNALCYDKAVSASRGERGLRAASARSSVKLRVSGCSRGLGHARGLGSENTS